AGQPAAGLIAVGGRFSLLPLSPPTVSIIPDRHRVRAHARHRPDMELPSAVPEPEHPGVLAHLAYHAVELAARLSVPADAVALAILAAHRGGARGHPYISYHWDLARRRMELHHFWPGAWPVSRRLDPDPDGAQRGVETNRRSARGARADADRAHLHDGYHQPDLHSQRASRRGVEPGAAVLGAGKLCR